MTADVTWFDSGFRNLSAALPDVFSQPAQHHSLDLDIFFFKHHHVAVAVDAYISEFDPDGMHAGLFEIFHSAMIIGRVIRRLCRYDESREFPEIRQSPCRRLLKPASCDIRSVRLLLLNDGEIRWVSCRRRISEWSSSNAPRARLDCSIAKPFRRSDILHVKERRPVRFNGNNGLYQRGPRIGDRPTKCAGLRVRQQDRRADLIE